MRKFIIAAAGAFAFSVSGSTAAVLSEDELAECVQQCIHAGSDVDAGAKYCAPYVNKRPYHLLDICLDSFKLGGARGCERGCSTQSCVGLRFDSEVVASRDQGCKHYHNQMPRPAAYEVCKEGYLKGFEARCQFVEGEFTKAREEEEAELLKHMHDVEVAVEQNSQENGGSSSTLVFEQQRQAEEEAAAAAKAAAEAEAAANAAKEHESLRGAAAAVAPVEEVPAVPEPVVEVAPPVVAAAEPVVEAPVPVEQPVVEVAAPAVDATSA